VPRRHRRKPEAPAPLRTQGVDFERRRRDACRSKERYATEAEARSIALMNAPRGRGTAVTAYHCDVCDGWHLTSR
jgi:hypothetical protein